VKSRTQHLSGAGREEGFVTGHTDGRELFDDPEFQMHFEDAQARSRLLVSLVRCRSDKRLAQKAVARLMGTTQSAVSQLESGDTDPRLSTLQRYARAVGAQLLIRLNVFPGVPGCPDEWPQVGGWRPVGPAVSAEGSPFQDWFSHRYLAEAGPVDIATAEEVSV
jgi:transcriptional regulator with XRE-family HTH domain